MWLARILSLLYQGRITGGGFNHSTLPVIHERTARPCFSGRAVPFLYSPQVDHLLSLAIEAHSMMFSKKAFETAIGKFYFAPTTLSDADIALIEVVHPSTAMDAAGARAGRPDDAGRGEDWGTISDKGVTYRFLFKLMARWITPMQHAADYRCDVLEKRITELEQRGPGVSGPECLNLASSTGGLADNSERQFVAGHSPHESRPRRQRERLETDCERQPMKGSLKLEIEKSADDIETCFELSLSDSIQDMTLALKRRGLSADAVATCTAHVREHSDRTFTFFMSEYRSRVGDLATRVERLDERLEHLEGRHQQ